MKNKVAKTNAILRLSLWGFLTFAKFYDLLLDETFNPRAIDWFVMIAGPLIIVFEVLQLIKANKEK